MGVLFEGYLQRRWSEHSPIEETFFALEGAEGRNVFLVLYPRAPVNGEDDCTVPEHALSLAGSWITPASDAIDPQCKRVKLFGFQLCFLPATGRLRRMRPPPAAAVAGVAGPGEGVDGYGV
jgi:hypothetical protein